MPLWNTVMIALVIGSTIAFCFWACIRCAGNDGKASGFTQQQTSYSPAVALRIAANIAKLPELSNKPGEAAGTTI